MSRLIDADILDDEVMHLFISITGKPKQHTVVNECKSSFRRMIEEQPTVEAVPVVRGEWERIPYSFAGGYRCSCCGQKTLEKHWKFCPNCGVNMRRKV